MIKFFQY